ncbi:MAG: radical SAM protein [Chloroflexota bacterium]|nr:MAG: radical SAM protein [Chloroflexota bacterium]
MECAVITTYRCNARCRMCDTWRYPTRKSEEFLPEILEKLPAGMKRLNITGGEPMVRQDIQDIVRILDKKTQRLEISTNGYFTDRIVKVCQEFPRITIRVSIEGLPRLNDEQRGIRNGFDHAMRTLLRVKQLGIKDAGFAIVISDRNCADLLDVYALCSSMGLEFGNATMHNSFYFHKFDNEIEDLDKVTTEMRRFIRELLTSKRSNLRMRVKDWGRAYINLGLLRYMQKETRSLTCGAATDTFFVSPWGEILACNGSPEPWVMGDLKTRSFDEIWGSPQAESVRHKVRDCGQNCWMTGTAVPAMRKQVWVPVWWILKNKARIALGRDVLCS